MPTDDSVDQSSTLWGTSIDLGDLTQYRTGQNDAALASVQMRDPAADADWTVYLIRDAREATTGVAPLLNDITIFAGNTMANADVEMVDNRLSLLANVGLGRRGLAVHVVAPTVNVRVSWGLFPPPATNRRNDYLRCWIARGRPSLLFSPWQCIADFLPLPDVSVVRIPLFASRMTLQLQPNATFVGVPTSATVNFVSDVRAPTTSVVSAVPVVVSAGGFVSTVPLPIPPNATGFYIVSSAAPVSSQFAGTFEVIQ